MFKRLESLDIHPDTAVKDPDLGETLEDPSSSSTPIEGPCGPNASPRTRASRGTGRQKLEG